MYEGLRIISIILFFSLGLYIFHARNIFSYIIILAVGVLSTVFKFLNIGLKIGNYEILFPLIAFFSFLFIVFIERKKIYYLSFSVVPLIIDISAKSIMSFFYEIPFVELNDLNYYYFSDSLVILNVFLILSFFILYYIIKEYLLFKEYKIFYLVFSFVFSLIIISFIVVNSRLKSYLNYDNNDMNIVLITNLIFIIAVIVLFLFLILLKKNINKKEEELLNYKYKAFENTYNDIFIEKQDKLLKLRHDMINIVETINDEKIKEELKTKLSESRIPFIVKNEKLNTILINKQHFMDENNIKYVFNVIENKDILIDDLDLISLFCNILDNVVENSINSTELVKLDLIIDDDIIISLSNPIGNKIKKDNSNYHGFGLRIIKEIVNKYDGSYDAVKSDYSYLLNINIKNRSVK